MWRFYRKLLAVKLMIIGQFESDWVLFDNQHGINNPVTLQDANTFFSLVHNYLKLFADGAEA